MITEKIINHITQKYVEKRDLARQGLHIYITPRNLLGIIRASMAIAKLRLSGEVSFNDVNEAINLFDYSAQGQKQQKGAKVNIQKKGVTSEIYDIIRNQCLLQ